MTHKFRYRTPFGIMRDTVYALFIRELRTRFGGSRLGYFWALFEPAAQTAALAVVFSLIGRHSISGVPVALFMVTGVLTFKTFVKIMTQSGNAVQANKALMAYRQVEPVDPVITRFVIEMATYFLVLVMLVTLMFWFLDYDVVPANPLEVLAVVMVLSLLGCGLGLLVASGVEYWPDLAKLVGVVTTPLMFVSGVMHSASMVPQQYWQYFTWNPIFHCMELLREAWFASYYSGFGDWGFVLAVDLLVWSLALVVHRFGRVRLINE